ncbi:hypothetical protein TR51_06715 [Kitasatospora griseola]|uniref:DUF3618 domain-containing protein n=1 Tax=Kitasatospora griseola TaxID=2064 RepID=A0A0D0P636_KITGR|nr:hypothetical protein TR51_06715 [Kitasatospora griseola]
MTSPTVPTPTPTAVDLLVVLTRLETKLDTVSAGIADHETRLRQQEQTALSEADIAQLRADVEALKRGRWPLPALGALTGVAALVVAAVPLVQH